MKLAVVRHIAGISAERIKNHPDLFVIPNYGWENL